MHMKPITNEDIKVLGRIVNISTENVVADASQVYDSNLQKDQQTINSEIADKTKNATTSKYGIVRLATSKNDSDNDDVPTVKILREAIQDAIAQILEDPNHSLLDNLNSIKELANALNNDPSFWTWVRDQLALKADKSVFDTLVTRVDDLDSRVTALEVCCEQVQEYLDNFSISWNQARGGNKVTITPSILRGGRNSIVFDVDPAYMISENLTQNNISNYLEGNYDTVTLSGFSDSGMTLTFTGVRSNIVVNAHIVRRYVNVTRQVVGDATDYVTFSNTSNVQNTNSAYTCTIQVTDQQKYWISYETSRIYIGETEHTLADFVTGTIYTSPLSDEDVWKISVRIPATSVTDDITLVIDSVRRPYGEITLRYVNCSASYDHHMVDYAYFDGQEYTFDVIPDTDSYFPTDGLDGNASGVSYININPDLGAQWNWNVNSNTGYGTFSVQDTGFTDDCTITITAQPIVSNTYTVTYNYDSSQVNISNKPASAVEHGTFSTVITPKTGYALITTKVTMGGQPTQAFTDGDSHEINIADVTGNLVITITARQNSTSTDYTVTKTTSNVTYSGTDASTTQVASGGSYDVTVAPASGYQIDTVAITMGGTDITSSAYNSSTGAISIGSVTGNIVITVSTSAESTPSGPAQVNVVLSNPNAGTANPASGTATSGNFSSNISFDYNSGYDANDSYLVVKDNDGNIITDGVSGYGVSYTYSSNSPTYSSISLTGLQDNKVYTATVYVVSLLGGVIFDAYGRTNEYGDTNRKGVLNYGGSHYGSSAGDYSTADPHTAGYAYGEIVLPDISTFNVSGSTNEEKVRNLVNNTTFQLSKIDNNGVISGSVFVLSADSNTPFSFTNGASVTGNTYISNTNNINIRLNGTIPVIDITCDRFINDTPSTDTYTITDGHPVVDSDPIFRDSNYGTHSTITEATSGSRQYIADSTWTDVLTMYNNTNGVLLFSRIFRYGYAIRDIEPVVASSGNGSVQYQAYAFPLSAIDHYEYTIVDGSNNTIDSGNVTVADDVNNAVLPNSVNTTTYPVHTVTVTAVPKSTASASSVVSTMTYDYSS